LIKSAKAHCAHLIVGVNSDELVASYKQKVPLQSLQDRMEIVASIRYVDESVRVDSLDKVKAWEQYHFDVVFIGDDWKGSERWTKTEADLKKVGVDVVYLPYTKGISSTSIRNEIKKEPNA
jgi:cytidyltransferase-like protein